MVYNSFADHTRTERIILKASPTSSKEEGFWILKIEYWLLGLFKYPM